MLLQVYLRIKPALNSMLDNIAECLYTSNRHWYQDRHMTSMFIVIMLLYNCL